MSENRRRPILYNGEIYSRSVVKSSGGGEKFYPLSYDEARFNLLNDIEKTQDLVSGMSAKSRLPNEIILSMTLQPEFSAKSYYPENLFDLDSFKFGIQEVGSRIWRERKESGRADDSTKFSKMFFLRATEESFKKLKAHLNKSTVVLNKGFIQDVRKISNLGILPDSEQIQGIEEDWKEGRLEAVLHPFYIDRHLSLNHFLNTVGEFGVNTNNIKYKQYESGVTFISFNGTREMLGAITGYNPLRVVHPLQLRDLPSVERGISVNGGFEPPIFSKKSTTTIGVIDGGLDMKNPFVKNYSDYEFVVSGSAIESMVDHGTQVTGTVLYGPLNNFSTGDRLPEPTVSVRNFGVLSSTTDLPDLYEAIDAIERIVPANPDIDVYNLSIGPKGPILDDNISRFTYACDKLSYDYDKLFCVAVGNDGHVKGYERIQAPSDSVNGLAVGAYTRDMGNPVRASYSSIGPGREGCKMKPDVLAFGGCDNHPIHLISSEKNKKILGAGTSFSTPIVSSTAASLISQSESVINPLTAKSLIIHSSIAPSGTGHSQEMGHGILQDRIEDIVSCEENSYTLIYKGEIKQGKYAQFELPWDDSIVQGKAHFQWTVAVMTEVDQLSSDDYTSSSVEVTFYPNSDKYLFTNTNNTKIDGVLKRTETVDIVANPDRAKLLVQHGWTQANFPKTDSPTSSFRTESELRDDLKWDSLDTREYRKMAKNVKKPFFHIHALSRGSRTSNPMVKFAMIFSVKTPKAEIDLYANVLSNYSALIPLQLRVESQVDVRSST
ncbi:S8 family serine peptidase [Muricauda sp. JGD-17]|uniref:S8 family serine peptidase n=1 Tax=Flagellimonas ochracea TaxID=2696472 RepID=A0A964TCU9_9FLAO|nr:S8 family peptidase [Allomuricauda ochracea]NAY91156.1 S8 family serine peptidase [Allomuricauda ochracea]